MHVPRLDIAASILLVYTIINNKIIHFINLWMDYALVWQILRASYQGAV